MSKSWSTTHPKDHHTIFLMLGFKQFFLITAHDMYVKQSSGSL